MPQPHRLLLTGFEPFGGDRFNPSAWCARAFDGKTLTNGTGIHSLVLPVSGPPAWRKLSMAIRRLRPHWIVATGVSGREELSVETTAWNEDDYRIPDNAGRQPQASRILSRGPHRLNSGPELTNRLASSRPLIADAAILPVRPSTDPGRFVCNHLYYRLLHLTRNPAHPAHGRSVFLHLPCTPEMRRGPGDPRFYYPLEDLRKVLLTIFLGMTAGQSPQPLLRLA